MRRSTATSLFICFLLSAAAFAGVTVTSPTSGSTVSSPVHFVASASSSNPITTMRIYVDSQSAYNVNAASLNTYLAMSTGTHNVVVQAWDTAGAVVKSNLTLTVAGQSTTTGSVTVASPTPGSTVGSPVHFVASATSQNPITTMRIYSDSVSVYSVSGAKVDTNIALAAGTHSIVVQAWDTSGAVYKSPFKITVGSASTGGDTTTIPSTAKTFTRIEEMPSWDHCTVCAGPGGNGSVAQYSMTQGVSSPSLDGNSAGFWIGGTTKYTSALWWKQLGANANVSHFVYDLQFYLKDVKSAFALEFDVNQSTGGKRYVMGTQCGNNYDKQWDVWDTYNKHWMPTGISCTALAPYTWHHLVEEFYRANGRIYYVSITLDGVKHYVNRNYAAISSGANDINVAFQMDMDGTPHPFNAWLDQVKLSYW